MAGGSKRAVKSRKLNGVCDKSNRGIIDAKKKSANVVIAAVG